MWTLWISQALFCENVTDNVFRAGDTEEEEEQDGDADEDVSAVDEPPSQSQLDVSADDAKPDMEVKSPDVKSAEKPAPKIASPVQQVMLHTCTNTQTRINGYFQMGSV